VRTANDGNMALQLALQECPDVIMTDWVMPGIDGLELCRRIRHLYECRVLKHYSYIFLLTAQTGRQSLLEGLNAGIDDFIEKGNDQFSNLKVEILIRLKTVLRMRNMQRELEYAAKYDFSTNLLNRSTFFEQGHDVWNKSVNQGTPLAAIMLDCDFFKRVNDTYGHQAGDSVLKSLASILQEHSRAYDIICRYGGEEFCALLPGCNEGIAISWAERIRKTLEACPILFNDQKVSVTASFGVAERVDGVSTLEELVEQADQALLFAKESGRNRTVKYSDVLADRVDPNATHPSYQLFFDNYTAEDVMIPLVLTVRQDESVATVAEFFLKTRVESLPVVDNDGCLVGFVSEKNLLTVVGNKERWKDSIIDLVSKVMVQYSPETPLKAIYNFLVRVSMRRVLIVKDHKPIGYIARNLLLRWLRNRWTIANAPIQEIVPLPERDIQSPKCVEQGMDYLLQQLDEIRSTFVSYCYDLSPGEVQKHMHKINEMVTAASKAQEVIEQILMANAGFANRMLIDNDHAVGCADEENSITRYGLFG
jgi:diguanylate cyclase (GGDEF) domain